jgi:hypothetical protein
VSARNDWPDSATASPHVDSGARVATTRRAGGDGQVQGPIGSRSQLRSHTIVSDSGPGGSHSSPAVTTPFPHAVGVQLLSQPSPSMVLPSSQPSPTVRMPLPHPVGVQFRSHPLPSNRSPSSHVSPGPTSPSPQRAQTSPAGAGRQNSVMTSTSRPRAGASARASSTILRCAGRPPGRSERGRSGRGLPQAASGLMTLGRSRRISPQDVDVGQRRGRAAGIVQADVGREVAGARARFLHHTSATADLPHLQGFHAVDREPDPAFRLPPALSG